MQGGINVQNIINYFLSLGSTVFVPIVLIIIGLIFRQGLMRSIRSAVTVGVGFTGLNLAISLISDVLDPAVSNIVERFGLELTIIDVGSGAAAGVAFGTLVGALIIPAVFILNIVMLVLGFTKTMNIDIFNYSHYAFTGAVVASITNSLWLGMSASLIQAAWSLLSADYSANMVQEGLGVEAVSIPQGYGSSTIPLFVLLERIYNKIPALRDSKLDLSALQKKIGMFGDPVIIAVILGIILSLLAGYNFQEASGLVIGVAAIMILFQRMVRIIVEGLLPISEAAKEFFNKRFDGREVYIGLDSAITLGHPVTQIIGTILIPLTLILAVILPGNKVLPMGDLAFASFFICMATIVHKGNIIKVLISGTINMIITLYIATWFGPYFTELAQGTLDIQGQATALWAGNMFDFVITQITRHGWVLTIALVIATVVLALFMKKRSVENDA